jgi:hypothetical protein
MKCYSKPQYEVADIVRKYGETYRKARKLQLSDHQVLNAIQACRTSVLGGHQSQCGSCNYQRNAYNSCRNRHCPKCQGLNQLKWIDKKVADLLPVGYFHLVFTIPHELNSLCLMNKKALYGILFKAAAETVTMLSRDPKRLGATPGIIAVLHTWGQNLMEHPHIHMIVTAGGLSTKGNKWVNCGKKFFLPVKVLSKVFRGKFLSKLKQLYFQGDLHLSGSTTYLKKHKEFKHLLDILYEKPWVVYAKKPFGNAGTVLRYLGRYTHRIAISNHRITDVRNGKVVFKLKDYADKNRQKELTLDAQEFIRRFLMHTLPKGFCKIRHYGMTANRSKKSNLLLARKLLKASNPSLLNHKESWQETLLRLTGFDAMKCPRCKDGAMKSVAIYQRYHPN